MFGNKNQKAVVRFEHEGEGHSGSSTSIPLKDGELLKHLKNILSRYGSLVIRGITDNNEVFVTNTKSVSHQNAEQRIEEIAELVRDFAKNRAYEMEGYAVLLNGQLKGIFGNESHAELKRKNLISRGFAEESVVVKPIHVNSFMDFE